MKSKGIIEEKVPKIKEENCERERKYTKKKETERKKLQTNKQCKTNFEEKPRNE